MIRVSPETLFQEEELEPLNTKGGNPAKHRPGHLSFVHSSSAHTASKRPSAEVQL